VSNDRVPEIENDHFDLDHFDHVKLVENLCPKLKQAVSESLYHSDMGATLGQLQHLLLILRKNPIKTQYSPQYFVPLRSVLPIPYRE